MGVAAIPTIKPLWMLAAVAAVVVGLTFAYFIGQGLYLLVAALVA